MTGHIRPFEEADYPAIAEVRNRVLPTYRRTAQELRTYDRLQAEHGHQRRYVADQGAHVVAYAEADQDPTMHHPQAFDIRIYVDPDWRERGFAAALYDYLMMALEPLEPHRLRAFGREDDKPSTHFLQRRGFAEALRSWEAQLALDALDLEAYDELIGQVEDQGIELRSIAELAEDPDRDAKLGDLEMSLLQHVPFPDERTPLDGATFRQWYLEHPNVLPEAYVVAVEEEGAYVGVSSLWACPAMPDTLDTGMTGVRRGYRRQGIALALKLQTLRYAQSRGFAFVRTWNASTNRPILAINERLGFERVAAWLCWAKTL